MSLDISKWNEIAAQAFTAHGSRPMPLVRSGQCAAAGLRGSEPKQLFPSARSPQGVLAGLLLYLNCWDEAHDIAQNLETPEGSYWHAPRTSNGTGCLELAILVPPCWTSSYLSRSEKSCGIDLS